MPIIPMPAPDSRKDPPQPLYGKPNEKQYDIIFGQGAWRRAASYTSRVRAWNQAVRNEEGLPANRRVITAKVWERPDSAEAVELRAAIKRSRTDAMQAAGAAPAAVGSPTPAGAAPAVPPAAGSPPLLLPRRVAGRRTLGRPAEGDR
jgi:hypothetical protein